MGLKFKVTTAEDFRKFEVAEKKREKKQKRAGQRWGHAEADYYKLLVKFHEDGGDRPQAPACVGAATYHDRMALEEVVYRRGMKAHLEEGAEIPDLPEHLLWHPEKVGKVAKQIQQTPHLPRQRS
jgi:hypothetical protein